MRRADSIRASCETRRGFTLVEVLVVMAIISILAGLITVSVQHARGLADINATRTEIQQLAAAAEGYRNGFGDYPPSSFALAPLRLKTNGVNEGNECLLAHLSTRKHGGPFLPDLKDDRLENLDNDVFNAKELVTVGAELDWTRGNDKLLEYVDLWGNPFVYLHPRDYRATTKFAYLDSKGQRVELQAARSEKTGSFQGPTSFQIWSFGPNRVNNNGLGDDIVSWSN